MNTAKRMVLVLPRNAEYEKGFLHYLQKMIILAKQIGARMLVCCHDKTKAAVDAFIQYTKISVEITFKHFGNIEDLLTLSREITRDDLLAVASARKGTLSHGTYLEHVPARLSRHFPDNNIILIFPEQIEMEFMEAGVQPEDLTLAPIQEQLANLNKLGKVVKRIFKGKK